MQPDSEQESDRNFVYGFATTIERFPILISGLILVVTFAFGTIAFLLHGFPSFGDPRLGFETRGTKISARESSFQKFKFADQETLSPVPHNVVLSNLDAAERVGVLDSEAEECPHPGLSLPRIVYKSSTNDDIFEVNHLKSICSNEEKYMRNHSIFMSDCLKGSGTDCCPSWSLGYAVALFNNKSLCSEINQDDVMNTKKSLATCSEMYNSGQLTADCNSTTCKGIPNHCLYKGLVYTIFHYLVPISFANDIELDPESHVSFTVTFSPICGDCERMVEIFTDNFQNFETLDDGVVRVDALQFNLRRRIFNDLAFADFVYVAFGVMAVTVIIWVYTQSLVITVGSILNMVMSMVLTFSLYFVVFRINFFSFINVVSSVLVLGIGCDDTFVYVDLWRAAQDKVGRGNDNRAHALAEATRHAFLTLFVTSLTTSSALYITVISNIIASKCFAIFAGTVLFSNFVYTITWMPCIIIIHDKYFTINPEGHAKNYCYSCVVSCTKNLGKIYDTLFHVPKIFFHRILPKIVFYLRFLWIILFSIVGIVGFVFTFAYPRLTLQETGAFRLFQDYHPFERYLEHYSNNLAFEHNSRETFQIAFIWGVLPTTTENFWDPLDLGPLELDNNFGFGSEESQEWLSDFCKTIKNETFYELESTSVDNFCFIDEFTVWMNRTCPSQEDEPCCEQGHFPFPENVFNGCVVGFAAFRCQRYPCLSYTPGLRFDRNNSLKALYLNFDSSVPYVFEFRPVDDFWQAVSTWTDDQLSRAPSGLQNGWSYSQLDMQLSFYDLQSAILVGTVITLAISLLTAMVVLLLSTQNILITLYAITTITFTVFCVIGTLVWAGWKLNIFESIIFSLAIGLSVDFTIHYGVAYRIAPEKDRKSRTFFAIETLGSSIAAAALSTITAGLAMIPTTVISYYQLGVFLALTISYSWLLSTFFFLPVCATIGPNGDSGQLLKPLWKIRKTVFSNEGNINPAFIAEDD